MMLGPRREHENMNDRSLVLRVDYGDTSFLFTGDCEREGEQALLEDGCALSVDVLKVGHHGSGNSTSYPFLREVMPQYAVISVGSDNDYGHPAESTLSRLQDAGVDVWRTDLQGTILAVSDGKTITLTAEKQTPEAPAPAESGAGVEERYIGNRNSKVFHLPACGGLPAEKNRVVFVTREEAVAEGYRPCGSCKP